MQHNPGHSLSLHEIQAGPLLPGFLSVTLIGLWAVIYWQGGGSLDAVRFIDRLMIRIAALLFSLSFTASALSSLFPGAATSWLLRNRRNLTISFLAAFVLHLCAIARFYALDVDLFRAVSPPLLTALRSLGVVLMILMLLDALGIRNVQRWKVLNTVGKYYIWVSFLNGFAKRVSLDRFYLLPVALLILALAVNVAEIRRSTKRVQQSDRVKQLPNMEK